MSPGAAVPPPVSWAQQNDLLYVTINVECKDIDYKFTDSSLSFKGTSVVDNKLHEVTLNFLNKINPDKVTALNSKRCLEFKIYKAESGPFWPTLTNDKKKPHFLKVDFNKWIDDDGSDQEQAGGEPESIDLLNKLVDMGVDKDAKLFDDFDDEEEDSDDENIPNLTDYGGVESNNDTATATAAAAATPIAENN